MIPPHLLELFFPLPLILRFLRLLWSLLCRVLPLSNQLNWNNDQNNVWILCKLGLILFKHHQENDDCAGTITAWGFSYAHCQKNLPKKTCESDRFYLLRILTFWLFLDTRKCLQESVVDQQFILHIWQSFDSLKTEIRIYKKKYYWKTFESVIVNVQLT